MSKRTDRQALIGRFHARTRELVARLEERRAVQFNSKYPQTEQEIADMEKELELEGEICEGIVARVRGSGITADEMYNVVTNGMLENYLLNLDDDF